jgi:AcrR family transcriptional regulator
MTTKEIILDTARLLFNKQGVESITTRHIAKDIPMSHGNLCYHYPRKEDIIRALYENLVAELDQEIAFLYTGEPGLKMFIEVTGTTFRIQYKYKFFLQNMVSIMRRIDSIRQHFKNLYLKRKEQFRLIISYLIAKGLIRQEEIQGQYEKLIDQFYIIGDFWVSEAEILFEGTDEQKLTYYTQIAFGLIIPYFTPEGILAYQQLLLQTNGD